MDNITDQEIVRLVQSGKTGPAIAAQLGLSRERVRQRYHRATGHGIPRPVRGVFCPVCETRYTGTRADHRKSPGHQTVLEMRPIAASTSIRL